MIGYLYCGAPFIPPSGNLSHALLPDELHPSVAGYRLLAACIAPVLGPLVQGAHALHYGGAVCVCSAIMFGACQPSDFRSCVPRSVQHACCRTFSEPLACAQGRRLSTAAMCCRTPRTWMRPPVTITLARM